MSDETAKHTPGPWGVEPATANHGVFVTDGEGATIADLYCVTASRKVAYFHNAEANARLIAAAPDLLAALEQIVRLNPARIHEAPQTAIARAAIAKARGDMS